MEKRRLGNTDLYVAPIAFGGNVFGWTIDEATSFEILDGFTEAGFNLIDTANSYSRWKPGNKGGESETIIGNWMQERKNRDQHIIATKVGSDMGDGNKGLSKKHITEAVEASLKRLKTDYIDLYLSHFDDQDTPQEETLQTYDELIKAGKLRWIGASNFSPERLLSALDYSTNNNLARYEVFQPEYNLYNRESFEQNYEQICTEHHLGVISYFSLASGFLSGKYRSEADFGKSQRGGGMKNYLNERGFQILKALDQVAEQYKVQQATVALAWLIAQPAITAPIASVTNLEQLAALTQAATLQLDHEALTLLNEASYWR
ncbi:aldo/keto reductase [Pedobacter sp.]|uniref:aldo/keto reductase n=1 Tax=Pedobacter sp. TaxID=1411316 RepID=UPI003D7FC385